jgi:DNA-binding beta-propeller fold protein YncE
MNRIAAIAIPCLWLLLVAAGMSQNAPPRMGKQPDGAFLVSSGQRIEPGTLAFTGRPSDLALHPSGDFFAILNKRAILIGNRDKIDAASEAPLGSGANASFRGVCWTPDGKRLLASTDKGHLESFQWDGERLERGQRLNLQPETNTNSNPVPGGMAITRDGKMLYVAAANWNAIVEIDVESGSTRRALPVQLLPFTVVLTSDESKLVVSNWGGRPPQPDEASAKSQAIDVLVDARGASASGTVSIIDRMSGDTRHVEVGTHPTDIALLGKSAWVATALDDAVVEVDLETASVVRKIPMRIRDQAILGSMPVALAVLSDQRLLAANGGDNALAHIDISSGKVIGYQPAGYFPIALAIQPDRKQAFVLNSKGNGSVARTLKGQPGNAHDFQGTVSVLDLEADLEQETRKVAQNNRWDARAKVPDLAIYQGAIQHVIYIIKENRTYDEVFGDLPQGNGDPRLCSLGERVMPNHRKLAQEFTLFDNGYVSGTNSADGHAWSTQSVANDYLEHFYVGYSRSYPDDGSDAMAISKAGAIWDAALENGKSVRVYGEFCDDEKNRVEPKPNDWFEVWQDRQNGTKKFQFFAETNLKRLKPLIHPNYLYWPLWQSDQHRADLFIEDYLAMSRENRVPNLMILSLPCDHAEGTNPAYPTPRAMMADNDLALGRIVDAVSHSPQWKNTCILVIEDDAQSGPDHVDGHRTVFMAMSPYVKRKFVDSSFYTTTHMIRSMGLMLGFGPLNRFDALADPLHACFTNTPDFTPYTHVPNNVPLDERNPSGKALTAADRFWLEKTMSLDWSHIDAPDPYWLNRINWYSIYKGSRPYPGRPGEAPGQFTDDDDEQDDVEDTAEH